MNTNVLQTLVSKSPPSTTTIQPQNLLKASYYCGRSIRISPINSTSNTSSSNGSDAPQQPVPPPLITPPPKSVEIRLRRGSRRQRKRREEEAARDNKQSLKKVQSSAPKKWEDMSLTEKAIELYMGEKGMLFWLNKFAYASIFIIIGAWILFRFVGPALNLYQLDSGPLPPSSIFKGS
ncbi:hypothetical protein ACOSP7_022701 [Xanthoceras sorbifolium]|uniref:Transmembrane protein n=1 Tax=Xanthoceras sorbifolium TaxID=99658 RepID=A0ABQ8HPJ5_9ROSI|nr:hypothetical protein JRO89_XS08G0130500 [Xanthoceras sorbifolium]